MTRIHACIGVRIVIVALFGHRFFFASPEAWNGCVASGMCIEVLVDACMPDAPASFARERDSSEFAAA